MSKKIIGMLSICGIIVMTVGLISLRWRLAEEQYLDEKGRSNVRTVVVYENVPTVLTIIFIGGLLEFAAALLGYLEEEASDPKRSMSYWVVRASP